MASGYQINPATGERELVVEITRGAGDPASPTWWKVALWIAALYVVYRAAQR
jgi:hypothetical protein